MIRHLPFGLLPVTALSLVFGSCRKEPEGAEEPPPVEAKAPEIIWPVMLGIDTLVQDDFAPVRGRKVGLLTHPAGVDRTGRATAEVLQSAESVDLVALFAPEHAFSGSIKAGVSFGDETHADYGLPIYSLHGDNRKPTRKQLEGLDALIIDLQDIGSRSYTFNVTMRYAMDACFEHGVEVIVLDRPNPLGGLKVDGPMLDPELKSGVGAFEIPYVHGLTIGELARMAADVPGILDVSEAKRLEGRLTVVPMRGWRRSMRWRDTGLNFVPTSPLVADYAATVGYAMIGLGCEYSGFKHGAGKEHPFRSISYKGKTPEQLLADFEALSIPGLGFRLISTPDANGQDVPALYVDVVDWEAWRPTEMSFQMMLMACRYDPPNPFAKLGPKERRSFNIHVGSMDWWQELRRRGARSDLKAFQERWSAANQEYAEKTRRYWIYEP